MCKLFKPLQILTNLPIQINNNNHNAITNIQLCKLTYSGLHHHYNIEIKHTHNLTTHSIISVNYFPTN
jgi:hypothetical protein